MSNPYFEPLHKTTKKPDSDAIAMQVFKGLALFALVVILCVVIYFAVK